jgi:hypothetical protein
MGDRGSYLYQDNLQKSITYAGTILVDLIPRIYDTPRVVKIIGSDDKEETVEINKTVIDQQTGKEVIVNDLAQGKYAVSARTGASSSNKKEESLNQLISITENSPELKMLVMDLIAKNSDINDVEELVERIRAMQIKQGVVEPTEEEKEALGMNQPQQPSPIDVATEQQGDMFEAQGEKARADARNKDADTQSKLMDAYNKSFEPIKLLLETLLKKEEAGIPVIEDEIDLVTGAEAIAAEAQIKLIESQAPQQEQQVQQPQQQPTPEEMAQIQQMQQGGQ